MRRIRRGVIPAIVVLTAVAVWGAASVYGADRPSTGPSGATQQRGGTIFLAKDQALLKTYLLRTGFQTIPLASNDFTPVGKTVKVRCPGTVGGCVVSAEVNVQVVANAGANVAPCVYLDGVETAQTGCIWVGEGTGDFANYSYTHTYKVTPGTHNFRVFVYPESVATAYAYSYVYNVYRNQ